MKSEQLMFCWVVRNVRILPASLKKNPKPPLKNPPSLGGGVRVKIGCSEGCLHKPVTQGKQLGERRAKATNAGSSRNSGSFSCCNHQTSHQLYCTLLQPTHQQTVDAKVGREIVLIPSRRHSVVSSTFCASYDIISIIRRSIRFKH